jgi:galactokinase
MPAGIDLSCCIAISFKEQGSSRMMAQDFAESFEFYGKPQKQKNGHWANYVFGVMESFESRGIEIPPFDLVIQSDIPIGAGLSSSAAFESVIATAFNHLLNCGFSSMELTRIAKEAENDYVGLQCGIMDMFASIHSKTNQAMLLDCRSLEFEYVPLELENKSILLIDTCIKHELSTSAYNERRNECEKAVSIFNENGYTIQHLRDVNISDLKENSSLFKEPIFSRAKHVITENDRVHAFAKALSDRDWNKVKMHLLESHESLKTDYEVSCVELDFIVDFIKEMKGVWGCRMMGGGFGGCVISIVDIHAIEAIMKALIPAYQKTFGITPKQYIARTGDGACEI